MQPASHQQRVEFLAHGVQLRSILHEVVSQHGIPVASGSIQESRDVERLDRAIDLFEHRVVCPPLRTRQGHHHTCMQIEAEGRVAWSDRRHGMGLQFEKVTGPDQTAIDEFVDAHFFSSRKA